MAKRRSVATAVLAGVTLLSTGGATGFLMRPTDAPQQLRAATELTSAPVGREDLTDERTVKINLKRSSAPSLVVGFGGRVTATFCRPGEALWSGQAVARIDNVPLIALATSMPLYRDLSEGAKGEDVTALQRELARLGRAVDVNGSFDRRTVAAVKEVQKAAGIARPDGAVAFGKILWLSAPSVVPESCDLVQGATVSSGQSCAKAPAPLVSIVVESIPQNAVAGERVIRIMGVTGPLTRDGAATDPEFLAKVAATRDYRILDASGKDPDLTAVIALKDRIQTFKVPPGALFDVNEDSGCIQSGARAYPVTIVGSKLGATLVALSGEVPDRVNLGSSITLNSCR